MDAPASTEFARPIEAARLSRGEQHFTISANEAERAALARRFDLLGLDALRAEIRLAPVAGGLIGLEAELEAEVIQACVVTLEPVRTRMKERFSLLYGAEAEARVVALDGAAETIEPIVAGLIDIGEAVAQQLSLALDPFPHAPGASTALARLVPAPGPGQAAGDPAPASPFKALARLRIKNNSKD